MDGIRFHHEAAANLTDSALFPNQMEWLGNLKLKPLLQRFEMEISTCGSSSRHTLLTEADNTTCSLTIDGALTRNYVDVSLQHSQGSPFGQAQFRLPPCSMQAISPRALMPTKVLRWVLQTSKVPPLVIPILVRDLRDLLSQFTSSGTCTICNKD